MSVGVVCLELLSQSVLSAEFLLLSGLPTKRLDCLPTYAIWQLRDFVAPASEIALLLLGQRWVQEIGAAARC